jgi:aconitate hydratase
MRQTLKQGLLGLTFATEADYDKIQENDTINLLT